MAGEPIPPEERKGPPQWLLDRKQHAMSDCRMFYLGLEKPPTESLMCFSWECGPGWNDALARLSYRIEALNLEYYPKCRVRCEAEQIKEKFGTLRAYTRVTVDPPAWRMFLPDALHRAADWMARLRVDCGMKKIVDRPRCKEYEYEQLTKEDFDKAERGKYKCSNVEYLEDSGRYYKVTALDRYEESHDVPTRHRLFYRLMNLLYAVSSWLGAWAVTEPTREQRVMSEFVGGEVDRYVHEAEKECYGRCEDCGRQIGGDWCPRCETKGWIAYVCEDCAKKRGGSYVRHKSGKDGEEDEGQD